MLVGEIDQFHELSDEFLCGRIGLFERADLLLMFTVTEAHDLDESPADFGRPVGSGLFVDFVIVESESAHDLPETLDEPRMLGAFVLGDDVAVGLKQHDADTLGRAMILQDSIGHCNNKSAYKRKFDNVR